MTFRLYAAATKGEITEISGRLKSAEMLGAQDTGREAYYMYVERHGIVAQQRRRVPFRVSALCKAFGFAGKEVMI